MKRPGGQPARQPGERGPRAFSARPLVRRLCAVAVVGPLAVIASSGLLRPEASPVGRVALGAAPAEAAPPSTPTPQLPGLVRAPASVTHERHPETPGLGVVLDARFAAVEAIPVRALAAYQRAETVMRQADESCHVSWTLIAAIGKVESNHGRYGGSLMTVDGVVHPGILGPRLTGQQHTSRIDDTDAGLLDGDQRFDRAVGPMQFIPSTWTVVGVDGDGDGRRDPQDIDDAALAAAVYLCSGTDDLATTEGQRQAVHRYNHSSAYVDLVLQLMAGYQHVDPALIGLYGGYGLPPVGTRGPDDEPTPGEPQPTFEVVPSHTPTAAPTATSPTSKPTATVTETVTPTPTLAPTPTPTPTPTLAPTPTGVPTSEPTAAPTSAPTSAPTGLPTGSPTPTDVPTGTPTGEPTGTPTGEPTEIPTVLLDAWATCLEAGVDPADLVAMTACLVDVTGLPEDDPDLLYLLANPPVTPPPSSEPTQQGRRRRPRV